MNLKLILAYIDLIGTSVISVIILAGVTGYITSDIFALLFANTILAMGSALIVFGFFEKKRRFDDILLKTYISILIIRACVSLLVVALWLRRNEPVLLMNLRIETIYIITLIAATLVGASGIAAAVIARHIKSRRYGVPSRLMTLEGSEVADLFFQTLVVAGIGVVLPFFILTLEWQWWSAAATAVCILVGFYVGLVATIPTNRIGRLLLVGVFMSTPTFFAYREFAVAMARGDNTLVGLEIYALVAILAHWVWAFVIVVWSFCTAFIGKPVLLKNEHETFISASRHNNSLWVVLPCEFLDGLYRYECGQFQLRSIESLEIEQVERKLVSDGLWDYKKKLDETRLMSALDMLYSGIPLEKVANYFKVDLEMLRAAAESKARRIKL